MTPVCPSLFCTSVSLLLTIPLGSIADAAHTIADGLQALYTVNSAGTFPYPPYYWWESGAAWGSMIRYWHWTNNDTYNPVTQQALVSNIGSGDFMLSTVPQEVLITWIVWLLGRQLTSRLGQRRPRSLGFSGHDSR